MRSVCSRQSRRSCLPAGATATGGAASRSLVVLLHWGADAAFPGYLLGAVVAGVDVADHARAWVVGDNPFEFLYGQGGAIGHADLAGVDGAADSDPPAAGIPDPAPACCLSLNRALKRPHRY